MLKIIERTLKKLKMFENLCTTFERFLKVLSCFLSKLKIWKDLLKVFIKIFECSQSLKF